VTPAGSCRGAEGGVATVVTVAAQPGCEGGDPVGFAAVGAGMGLFVESVRVVDCALTRAKS